MRELSESAADEGGALTGVGAGHTVARSSSAGLFENL